MPEQAGACDVCKVNPGPYQKQIRRLREKLEYAEVQNLRLVSESNRLRQELREAEFRGRSSVSKPPCPSLPNELLQEIFSLATHMDGDLVSPHWRIEEPYIPWVISSLARRSIPLVCRQWHKVGLEYLYQHVVIFSQFQLSRLLRGLRVQHVHWIRGLEFILLRDQMSTANELTRQARGLIGALPRGRLRIFGFEHGDCSTDRNAMEIVADGLEWSEGSLESLHMPCLREPVEPRRNPQPQPQPHPQRPAGEPQPGEQQDTETPEVTEPDIQEPGTPESEEPDPALKEIGFTGFSRLQTLSLTRGRWESCGGQKRARQDMISALANTIHAIHTVYLNWYRGSQANNYLTFLHRAVHLQTIHVIIGRTPLLIEDLDDFLEAVPQLRRLVITPSDKSDGNPRKLDRNMVSQQSLTEIVLEMHMAAAYKTIFVLNPLFSKIESGRLPGLKRVVIRGPYPEGCIDSRIVLPSRFVNLWKTAIEACEKHEIEFVDEEGNEIHLWNKRHGISFGSEEDTDSDGSFEDEWWEMSDSGYLGSAVADDEVMSNDSSDSPYRYVSHPDLDYVTESGGSDNS